MMDLGIVGGAVYLDDTFYAGNVYIKDGKVVAITTDLLEAQEIINAESKWVLPGFIDPHVHFALSVGKNTSEDDFITGSRHGALGGITTYIDFLDPVKAVSELSKAYEERAKLASGSVTDYSFHVTVANPSDDAEAMMKASKALGLPSIKLFTTYSDTDRRTYDAYIDALLKYSRAYNCHVVIHAENDEMIMKDKRIAVKDHETARPAICELTEVSKLAAMAKYRKGLLYIVHVSAGSTIEHLVKHYGEELKNKTITVESCPHYFLLNREKYEEDEGYLYTMTPPLRSEKERLLLNEYEQYFDTIATDHCPFSKALKAKQYTDEIPMGIGGIQYAFVNMFTEFGEVVIPQFTKNPAKAYGLYPKKGNLLPGADGDVVIFDPNITSQIEDEKSVYNGKVVKGKIERVYLRGELLVNEGRCMNLKGMFVRRI